MADKTAQNNSQQRPPIVVVMGHVDHGKTTLLDYIRKSNVAAREAGGITQAVAAYEIEHTSVDSTGSPQAGSAQAHKMTFIDTPGHEAFTKMRSRGANIADLAILVVAAEEGVKPQTQEAIKILQETKTPFVVAINKIDKPSANIEKVCNELSTAGVYLEGYGGQVSYQGISAKTGEGVKELLDFLLLAAELENLTYDPSACARGYILEARLSKQRGNEVSVIVKNGTLHVDDTVATASANGKIKILENFLGKQAKELVPSAPAYIVGFEKLPQVGEEFFTNKEAEPQHAQTNHNQSPMIVNSQVPIKAEKNAVTIVLKASDSGSLEALSQILGSMTFQKPLRIVYQGVGEINDHDVKLLIAPQGLIIGFKTSVNKAAKALSETHKVTILTSEIIYDLVQQLEKTVNTPKEETFGELEVLAVFSQKRLDKQLVGGKVLSGNFKARANFEIRKGEAMTGSGKVVSLRDKKQDINSIGEGHEVGIVAQSGAEIQVGDRLVILA